jgi:phosphoribosyl 1,2-cyclic phosphodiesterase
VKIHFYGVRGSIATPGRETAEFGGNTSCVFVEMKDGSQVIFDAGTGIRPLGDRLVSNGKPIQLLLSHTHWDHIQGFPFFKPAYQTQRDIFLYPPQVDSEKSMSALLSQMDGVNFPVLADQLPGNIICVIDYQNEFFAREGIDLKIQRLNHPGGGHAFRLSEDGSTLAYVTDNELDPPGQPGTTYDQWVKFCHGADVLIHDAQYTEDDMPHKHGWGHSLISQVRQLACDAEVKTLVLFHHDPERTDSQLKEIQLETDYFFRGKRWPTRAICAYEGMELEI